MVWFLYLVSIAWIAGGSALILHTERIRDYLERFVHKGSLNVWGGLLIAGGILLAAASFWSGVVWFLFLLGLIMIGKGLFFLLGRKEQVLTLIGVWIKVSDTGYRLWGLVFVIMGVAILAWI